MAKLSNNGFMKFVGSEVFSNFAIQTPIAQFFDSSETSVIENTKIHNNEYMTPDQVHHEMSGE